MTDKKNILIVEDNDFVRMQVARYLKEADFDTAEARDGNEALQLVTPDMAAAIVDVRMHPMGGLDFVKALKGKEIKLPVIFMTGDQNTDLLEQAAKWGVTAILIKPVMKDRLVMAVQRAISLKGRHE